MVVDYLWWFKTTVGGTPNCPLTSLLKNAPNTKKKYWWAPANPAQFCSKLLAILKKSLGGPRQILLNFARNTKKSIGGPRKILLNFAQK